MAVQAYGCNHIAIEVDDVEKAVAFFQDVFNLERLPQGEGDAFMKLGEHQFLAIFRVDRLQPSRKRHFGIMVRDEGQLEEVRQKLTKKYGIKLIPPFGCDFVDPFGNRIQVVDLHDESMVWLLPYQEVQKAGIVFPTARASRAAVPTGRHDDEPHPDDARRKPAARRRAAATGLRARRR
jgi:catechol 2,3-dioxygenase-like lactoylglutathione lyase family enzyme